MNPRLKPWPITARSLRDNSIEQPYRTVRHAAFTLVEMLVVIAIIAILAGLIIWGAGAAAEKSKRVRVVSELQTLETAIENYQSKLGFFPPDNNKTADPARVAKPPLYYELSGATLSGNSYTVLSSGQTVTTNVYNQEFGRRGVANSDPETAENFLKTGAERLRIATENGVVLFAVSLEGPVGTGLSTNTWRYNSSNPVHNPKRFDLWAEIVIKGKTNIIGNWKE